MKSLFIGLLPCCARVVGFDLLVKQLNYLCVSNRKPPVYFVFLSCFYVRERSSYVNDSIYLYGRKIDSGACSPSFHSSSCLLLCIETLFIHLNLLRAKFSSCLEGTGAVRAPASVLGCSGNSSLEVL